MECFHPRFLSVNDNESTIEKEQKNHLNDIKPVSVTVTTDNELKWCKV